MLNEIKHVAIVGSGIGGLMSALALNKHGIRSTIFEKDPSPQDNISPADSMKWVRKGVHQALHPHFFMGRLRLLIKDQYPELYQDLLAAGSGESAFRDYVHPSLMERIESKQGDDELKSINCRRTTFEMTVRSYVKSMDNVKICDNSKVVRILANKIQSGQLEVHGVELKTDGVTSNFSADAVIDASGRTSQLTRQLTELGAVFDEEVIDSGIFYFTRHYKLKDGQDYPDINGLPGAQYHEFMIGALPADNRALTVTFQISKEDKEAVAAIRDPDHFQKIAFMSEPIKPWVDPETTIPTSEIYAFGHMDSFWRRTVLNDKASVLNYFCVGDSGIRGNPKYGRGSTWSAVAAHLLADLMVKPMSSEQRISQYEDLLEREFRKDWHTLRKIDLATQRNFKISLGKEKKKLSDSAKMFFGKTFEDALVTEPELFREVWREFHGLAHVGTWQKRPMNWMRLFRSILTRRRTRSIRTSEFERPSHLDLISPPS